MNYVLSNYPDESWTGGVFTAVEREQMLDFSFRHWKQHSPLTKGYLALTLERAGRHDDAVLVFDAVMDSSKTDEDLRHLLGARGPGLALVQRHHRDPRLALRVLTELEPDDARRHGLVHWLLLEQEAQPLEVDPRHRRGRVLAGLLHAARGDAGRARGDLGRVGPKITDFVFEPDEYTGARNRVIVTGEEIDPATMSTIVVEKVSKGFAFASATWSFSTERLPDEARGDLFAVERSVFPPLQRRRTVGPAAAGRRRASRARHQVEVQLSIRAKARAEYVHLRDPRGAGFEPETLHSQYKWDLGIFWYEEVRDSGTNFFFEWLPAR